MKRRILTLMMSAALIAGTQSTVWADVEDYSDEMFIRRCSCICPDSRRWKCLRTITVITSRKVFL